MYLCKWQEMYKNFLWYHNKKLAKKPFVEQKIESLMDL